MTKCKFCGAELPCCGNPPYIIKHISPTQHLINGDEWITPVR